MEHLQTLKKVLDIAIEQKASDLLISVGHPPVIRITGQLAPLMKEKKLTAQDCQGFAYALIGEEQKKRLSTEKEIDFSYDHGGKARFRVNIFYQQGAISMALRLIPSEIKTIEDLGLPPVLHEFTNKSQGLVLVTGASGQGKSTTLASLIDEINQTRAVHIITIEDPIEYLYQGNKAIVEQREVSVDTNSFPAALRAMFRQNPDVIMVGEMRDLETISTTITAAETGHLVFATLHTNSAAQSIHRMIDVFPPEQQNQIRFQLAASLLGVVSQRLVPRLSGGFVPACEVMIANPAISNLIRENKNHEIPAVIETSSREGMLSLNRALADLVRNKEISLKDSVDYSLNPLELKNLLR
ncbi:MAG: type IV pili twitching motility protein PilT [Candidatus Staskawiczbacteria bacterium RIFCSPHIGHO2_02_FULL_43_16]|uniref:Type IV pili twitching motility protein PilT n=1 Tax=Candidatus Staskawiczbacteria bacterium RIFCSPHIGHO2_01_FULL_41_41 TaxID=1802203 RepID=A0A1G2HV21_9BACT|nr:MAG: type IV pili twitching motility protein PilT [Candidatus Staskawiczbacteria bacterium RIFCSPHIGHO2_01_FULL_41_41]OGZ68179.1 MAG: type IV pili twitching motility protein PilT [Candidatus Staskawiczbacteria bacterium RIFCSPHIGHO2_02_FULL_43_16]OGZ74969.1 MAG: type IV pili twitching motility protein PilT [Candidatus Staskawiczbacteria bacterium RIFCSPLOWO2_01_FULL_43_17b]